MFLLVIGAANVSQNATLDVASFADNSTGGAAMSQINCKYPAVVANYAVGNYTGLIHPIWYNYGAYGLFDQGLAAQGNVKYTPGKVGGRHYTFQLISSLFGGCAEKFLPISTVSGIRIILSCENMSGVFVLNEFGSGAVGATDHTIASVSILDPLYN